MGFVLGSHTQDGFKINTRAVYTAKNAETEPEPGPFDEGYGNVRLLPRDGMILFCINCGETCRPTMPAAYTMVESIMKSFGDSHKKCEYDDDKGHACSCCFEFGHDSAFCHLLEYNGDYEAWWKGPDSGLSSKALMVELLDFPDLPWIDYGDYLYRVPADADDFGRCFRMITAFPELRARIDLPTRNPTWSKFFPVWQALEDLYMDAKDHELYLQLESLLEHAD